MLPSLLFLGPVVAQSVEELLAPPDELVALIILTAALGGTMELDVGTVVTIGEATVEHGEVMVVDWLVLSVLNSCISCLHLSPKFFGVVRWI